MTLARSVSEVLSEHVVLEIEGIDRLYLNLYVPILQRPEGCAHFWIHHRGQPPRRLLDVQRISRDALIGEDAFAALQQPRRVQRQRASALRLGDPRVLALLTALVLFRLLPRGFANRDLREHVAGLMGKPPEGITPGRMTYDLRRLRLHGLIERIPKSRRYRVTDSGFRTALFLTRSYARLFRPGLSALHARKPAAELPLRKAFDKVEKAIERAWKTQQIAA